MQPLRAFLLRITTGNPWPGESRGMTYIVIRRAYAHLEGELRRAFESREDVKVIVDRRHRERRTSPEPVMVERRSADRRRAKEELVEVLTVGSAAD